MRKQTKLVAVLSAAALLAIGASMTSFAAAPHWDQQDGEWVYLDRNGDRVTDEWKKSNGQWYYLDEDGFMAREVVIEDDDDKYYVGADGARVTNTWISMDNDDLLDDDDEVDSIDTVWMYFDGTGKALGCGTDNGEIKRLTYGDNQTGYFIFNVDGYMLSGWKKWDKSGTNSDLYYLGTQDQGWAHTSWQSLEVDTDLEAFDGIDEDDSNYKDEAWFYFKQNGKAYKDEDATIGGKTYVFDEYGRMLDLWVYPETIDPNNTSSVSNYTNNSTASSSSPQSAYYREDNGGREKNWVFAYPNSDYDNYGDDPYWFYLTNKGKPFRAITSERGLNTANGIGSASRIDDDPAATTDADAGDAVGAKSIKNNTYLFNKNGVMLTGLFRLRGVYKGTSAAPMTNGYYYFTIDGDHSSAEGQLVTNKKVTLDVHGDDETYYFDKTGRAYENTIISGYLYGPNGQLVNDNGDGNTYQMVTLAAAGARVETATGTNKNAKYNGMYVFYDKSGNVEVYGNAGDYILINENGKIKQSGTVTDTGDQKVKVSNYIVVELDGNAVAHRADIN